MCISVLHHETLFTLFTKAKVIIVQSTKKEAALCLTCLESMLGKLTQFEDKSLSASL